MQWATIGRRESLQFGAIMLCRGAGWGGTRLKSTCRSWCRRSTRCHRAPWPGQPSRTCAHRNPSPPVTACHGELGSLLSCPAWHGRDLASRCFYKTLAQWHDFRTASSPPTWERSPPLKSSPPLPHTADGLALELRDPTYHPPGASPSFKSKGHALANTLPGCWCWCWCQKITKIYIRLSRQN